MALTSVGGVPLIAAGSPGQIDNLFTAPALTVHTANAANGAVEFIGYVVTADGGSHTIDTTGSSSLGWRPGSVTFASGSTTVKVGLATVDATTGPPARATNAAGVVTYSVSKSLTGGGGGITASSWNEHVPDSGSLTIANGDLVAFAVQMTARGGTDSVVVDGQQASTTGVFPSVTTFNGTATYSGQAAAPLAVITFSDGTLGFFFGAPPWTSLAVQSWNSGSALKEYGNAFNLPFPCIINGVYCGAQISGDIDVVLYETPFGTPSAAKTVSIDANTVGTNSLARTEFIPFPTPYTYTENTDIAVVVKPATATNVFLEYITVNAAAHMGLWTFGTGCYAVNRNTGAFSVQNSNKDRFQVGLLISAVNDTSSSGGGVSRSRAFTGM